VSWSGFVKVVKMRRGILLGCAAGVAALALSTQRRERSVEPGYELKAVLAR
jgi:hypothetical protein